MTLAQSDPSADLFKKSNQRIELTQKLIKEIDKATDPAAKDDLTNRMIAEQNRTSFRRIRI
jgi:Type IV secretion system proteins